MTYVEKVISEEEKILFVTGAHWIHIAQGLLWFAVMVMLGQLAEYYIVSYSQSDLLKFNFNIGILHFSELHTPIPWLFTFTGFIIFWRLFMIYMSSEIGITNESLVYKTGLIFAKVQEIDLTDIGSEKINYGYLGVFLNYGYVHIESKLFSEDMNILAIPHPCETIKKLHMAKMEHPDIEFEKEDAQLNSQ